MLTRSIYWLSGATVVSTALVPVFGVLALVGLVPLNLYCYFGNLDSVAR